ncbi:MAG TPA: cystatin domain-containing protein [Pyrinomonadaceae bacterium]
MKKSWRVVALIAAFHVVLGGLSVVSAQQDAIAGAYAAASTNDPEVVSAARFAATAAGRKTGARVHLLSIESAEQQVVAGLNYRLQLKVRAAGKSEDVTAVVYKNLQQKYSLTSWEADANSAGSSSTQSGSAIERLVDALDVAFMSKNLGSLDARRPFVGKVRIVIEHSLAADDAKDRFEVRDFRKLAKAEQWLRSREQEELPFRETRPLEQCRRGVCTYDFNGGILHNRLYLKEVRYGMRNGRPYLKRILLLDGD